VPASAPVNAPDRSAKRVLLFAEAVTLAHVARPLCFAAGLAGGRYRFAIAAAGYAAPHVAAAGFEHLELESVEPRRFLAALAKGRALYDTDTLQRYVRDDLALIERFAPDLVVGDFRLSLSVSARLARVPYVSIASAYWSPCYRPPRWPVPSLPFMRRLPLGLAQAVFAAARPLAFALHCGPLNRVRSRNGLPPLARDLRRIYTDADYVAYSDLPELFPMEGLPASHRFLGPALWQPASDRPAWWSQLPFDRPCVYVTLGSSGDAVLLPRVIDALAPLPVTLLVATAGAALPATLPPSVRWAPYLPGLEAAQRSQLVICNGGSLTAYQALAGGALVLGIAGNLDQFLNMQAFERAGVGRMLRADRLSTGALRAEAEALLSNASPNSEVGRLRAGCAARRFDIEATALVDKISAE
jgi:UDP:flavonoid glycosyltransferase YjiC (YdhE family)